MFHKTILKAEKCFLPPVGALIFLFWGHKCQLITLSLVCHSHSTILQSLFCDVIPKIKLKTADYIFLQIGGKVNVFYPCERPIVL